MLIGDAVSLSISYANPE